MRRDAAGALARATVVVGLLALAALGTAARQGLPWRSLLDPPRDRVAAAVLLVVGAAAAAGLLRLAIEAWRRRARRRLPRPDLDRVPEEIELDRRAVVVSVVVAVALAVAIGVAGAALIHRRAGPGGAVQDGSGEDGAGPSAGVSPWWIALLLAVLVLLATALLATWWSRRAAGSARTRQPARSDPTADAVAAAAAAARASLRGHDEVRAAILAAYDAMVAVLAARGAHRRPTDTAGDLLQRALRSSAVPPRAGAELTALFREARFSSHPMAPHDRRRAEHALAEVAAGTGEGVDAHG